ncbi:MAG: sugar isomerase, partial [Alphaproteobacteria bacterium]|nr:sugar isomerase [Alphaproteobacteria bacterium]
MSHADRYFGLCKDVCDALDHEQVDALAGDLRDLRERNGRLFVLGVGGSAGNASHAVN